MTMDRSSLGRGYSEGMDSHGILMSTGDASSATARPVRRARRCLWDNGTAQPSVGKIRLLGNSEATFGVGLRTPCVFLGVVG